MKFITVQSCKQLFIRSVILQLISNIIFLIINNIIIFGTLSHTFLTWLYIFSGMVQLIFSLLLGLHIRKKNKAVLENRQEKKLYKNIILIIGIIFLFIIFTEPDIIFIPHTNLTILIYELFGIDRLFTVFDFSSIVTCLGAVFF